MVLTRTPLSTRAKPFTPKAETWSGPNQMLNWMPIFVASNLQATVAPDFTQNEEPKDQDVQQMRRGRKCTREDPHRLPSRTPSPSMSLSEVSTLAESSLTQDGSSGNATSDVNEYSEDSKKLQDFVVKNTFIHLVEHDDDDAAGNHPKLLRCLSAPGSLLSCPFKTYTMLELHNKAYTVAELHEMGRCKPCAYRHGKADGCRLGSECGFCHACPPQELKNRKRMKVKAIKNRKREAWKADQAASHEPMLGDDIVAVVE